MTTGARGWILWVSLAIMVADSIVSLIPVVNEFIRKSMKRGTIKLPRTPHVDGFDEQTGETDQDDDNEVETEDRLVPMKWVFWGLGSSMVVGTLLVWLVFGKEGIRPWATVIGFVMGGLLSILG